MTDRVFIDTNVFLYAEFDDGSEKHKKAKNLILHDLIGAEIYVSTQVFSEFYVQSQRKGKTEPEIEKVLLQYSEKFNILPIGIEIIKETWRIKSQYQFSYWDSLIIAASLKGSCNILYSEDLQDGQIIDESLAVRNPFL